jgi:hypothetical protein
MALAKRPDARDPWPPRVSCTGVLWRYRIIRYTKTPCCPAQPSKPSTATCSGSACASRASSSVARRWARGRHTAAHARLRHPGAPAPTGDRLGCAGLREGTAPGGRRPARRLATHLRRTGPRAQYVGQVRPAQEQAVRTLDRGTDLPDCIALAPTAEDLAECVPWLEVQDGNELWPAHGRAKVADLARRASCSFATAWQAAQDYRLLRAARQNAAQR